MKEEKEKLTKDILAEKRGLNEEGQEIFNEIQEQENVLFKLREERKKVESKAEKRKVQLENLEVESLTKKTSISWITLNRFLRCLQKQRRSRR